MGCKIRKFKKHVYVETSNVIHNMPIKEALSLLPVLKENNSIYEIKLSDCDIHIKRYGKISDLLYEIPLIKKKRSDILTEYKVPQHLNTKPAEQTVSYVVSKSILLPKYAQVLYYDTNNKIPISIVAAWPNDTKQTEENNIISLFKTCGYYLGKVELDKDIETGIIYKVALFEPFWPDNELIRYSEYIYHITTVDAANNIDKNGFVISSESDKFDNPDRIYFFLTDDRKAMFNYMRTSHKLKSINDNVVIYKVKVPDNITLYVDTRNINLNDNIIDDCVFTYDNISAKFIENKIVVPIKGQLM